MARRVTVYVHEDQLTRRMAALESVEPATARVLMIESLSRARRLPFHKQRLVLVWSAMRHFANELREAGYDVDYRAGCDDFAEGIARHCRRWRPAEAMLMQTAEHGLNEKIAAELRRHVPAVTVLPNNMFISDTAEFASRAEGKKSLVMEGFYRRLRRKTGLLMDGDGPAGGRWNFDAENRRPPPADHTFPSVPHFRPDAETRKLLKSVARDFPDHFGRLDDFSWPVTRRDARRLLRHFLDKRLDLFGPYQDAMVLGEPVLYHSLLSPLLNLGLLDPLEVCRRAEQRYRQGKARLNSVEGFVRQILGWREYIYQVYHLRMPGYTDVNHFDADIPLPDFYWTGRTDMACIADAIEMLLRHGLNHHILRLMITGNFALIAGIDPQQVNEWYWLAYLDAWEWVVSPNVLGMALYADGGLVATKPYAASANYIRRMSDYCSGCRYNPREAVGPDSCPFNALYWDFLHRHRAELAGNRRMSLMLGQLDRRQGKDLREILARARQLRRRLRRRESL